MLPKGFNQAFVCHPKKDPWKHFTLYILAHMVTLQNMTTEPLPVCIIRNSPMYHNLLSRNKATMYCPNIWNDLEEGRTKKSRKKYSNTVL